MKLTFKSYFNLIFLSVYFHSIFFHFLEQILSDQSSKQLRASGAKV